MSDDYEGVTHAGIAVQAADTGRILMQQRALDPEDPPEVQGTWEFPGGGLEDGEQPQDGAWREWNEETGLPIPDHEITGGWRSPEGVYQGFVATVADESVVGNLNPDIERADEENPDDPERENPDVAAWFSIDQIKAMGAAVRPEVLSSTDWDQFGATAPEEADMTEMTDETPVDDVAPVPWFGVLAPEGVPSGDKRMFGANSLRMRPLPLPLTWQKVGARGHDGHVTVATIEKVWRQAGKIWGSGHFLQTPEADEAMALTASFGRYGVSIDADDLDEFSIEVHEDGLTEFTDARACSACMVSIPAFAEAWIMLGEFSEEFVGGWGAPSQPIPTVGEDAPADDECEERDEDGNCIERPDDMEEPDFSVAARDVSTEERDNLADEGKAMPDGSYPIANCDDLKNAIQAIGRAKDPEAVKRHIRKRKSALGCPETEIPDTWAVKTEDGPGWLTHPIDTDRLRDYWVRGEGAAKIAWGTPGDFNRCRVNLAKYVKPQYLSGYCANRHYDALGFWPAQHSKGNGMIFTTETTFDTSATKEITLPEGATEVLVASAVTIDEPDSLTAAAPRADLDGTWFEDPGLSGPTALTITEDGRVFGHLATWGTCHIGFSGKCTEVPRSASQYAYFRTGMLKTSTGNVTVGSITMGGGHAGPGLKWRAAAEHYDSTSAVVADVAVGEDKYGVWFAGAMRAGVDEGTIAELQASGGLSGDWREVVIGSNQMELVAALAVNVGGFPVPRVAAQVKEDRVVSLVAAGFVEPDPIDEIADAVIARMEERQEARTRQEALRAQIVAERQVALRAKM